jgi:hypothetical protein
MNTKCMKIYKLLDSKDTETYTILVLFVMKQFSFF